MEFENTTDTTSTFFINENCSYVIYNGSNFVVTKVNIFNHEKGFFTTQDYIIKFSKNDLFLYNKNNVLLDTFKFTKLSNVDTSTTDNTLIGSFILKKDFVILLYKTGDTFYIIYDGITENVLETFKLGDFITVYNTELNSLKVSSSSTRHHQWNKIPIGVL
jgi:hypothetical protein